MAERTADGGCLGCELVAHKPKTLIDGRTVCSSCEDWRLECEARAVLDLPSLESRRAHLAGIEKARGKEAGDRLRRAMMDEWKRRKVAA